MLFNIQKQDKIKKLFTFTLSRFRSFYLDSIFIMINRVISWIQTHLFPYVFIRGYFWIITLMKNVNNFQIAKIQSQGVAKHLIHFLSILAWRCSEKCCLSVYRINRLNIATNSVPKYGDVWNCLNVPTHTELTISYSSPPNLWLM